MNDTQPSFLRGDKVCRPADWIDVVKFFGFNFALHAMTVVSHPGDTILETTIVSLCAVLIPFIGVGRAMVVLSRLVFLSDGGEIGKALSANALCMLVPARYALGPRSGMHGESPIMTDRENAVESLDQSLDEFPPTFFGPRTLMEISPLTTVVHGQYPADIRRLHLRIPGLDERTRAQEGALRLQYKLVAVPLTFSAVPLLDTHGKHTSLLGMLWDKVRGIKGASGGPLPLALSCNYSFLKTCAALIQILYGSYELYMISDDQIRQYGYGAYQFTVIPYVIMSILNLLAALSAPSYPARYIVHYRGLQKPNKTKELEHGKQAVSSISIPAEGTRADIINVDAAMQEDAERGDREIYPQNWWNKEERDSVEKMVAGAVGYVYGDLKNMSRAGKRQRVPTGDLKNMSRAEKRQRVPTGVNFFPIYITLFVIPVLITITVTPYVVLYLLTRFEKGKSSALQRGFTMAWLVFGQCNMVLFLFARQKNSLRAFEWYFLKRSLLLGALLVAAIAAMVLFPPVAGFYMVSKMILNDKTCSRV